METPLAGQVLTGPLYIIEKLRPGASIETGDWWFLEIKPDGSLIGAAPDDVPAAERRQVTVMFCDLVGSTELSRS